MAATIPKKRDRHKRPLASHALDNAKQRLAAFYERHREVLDEYSRLREEVRGAAVSLAALERNLRLLVRDLGGLYEQ